MGTWLRRLGYLLRQSRHEAELREEIEAHRALRAADLEQRGLTPPEAAAASQRAIGNVLLAREDSREIWLGSWATWSQDVRYGFRTLRRSPAFTAVAVATLALGIGVNTGIFTVVNAVLFRDLPARDGHELVSISQAVQGVPGFAGEDTFSTSEYLDYRDRAQTLSGLAAHANVRGGTTLGGDAPQTVLGVLVSCNYFDLLQQPPALGRALAARDCEPGADLVVVLSHELWRTVFEAEPGIVGRTIEMNRQPVTVAGVAAEGTYSGSPFLGGSFFAPLSAGRRLTPDDSRYEGQLPWLTLLGRHREGVGLAQVRAEFDVIAAQIDQQRPGRSTRLTIGRANPALPRQLRDRATGAAAIVMTAFGFILLIACANVASLLLARGTARSQEIAIRVSLGASRARVIRQLVAESLLLAAVGGVIGSMVALWSIQALVALAIPVLSPEQSLAFTVDVSPDAQVLRFAMALTLGTGLLFGLAPAWHVSKHDLHAVMKQDSTGAVSRRGARLRGTLVGVEVALCMMLMIAAGLLLRGLQATYTIDPSFQSRNIVYASLESAFEGYSPEASAALRERLIADVGALPGVEAVAYAMRAPLANDNAPVPIRLPGERENGSRTAEVNLVTPDFFSLLGIPIVRGRTFTETEIADAGRQAGTSPAIVSQATARNLWPGRDPIGRTLLSREGTEGTEERTLEIVGVAADARVTALGAVDPYYVYQPGGASKLLVKSRMDVGATASSIRRVVRKLDASLVVPVIPLEENLGWWRGVSGTVTTLFGALAVLALVLASVGIYGVVSYAVNGRYREIGVRLALGATAWGVLGLVLRQTMRPVVVGAAIGIVGAGAVSSILSSVLFGVSPADPIGLGGAALFVLGVALAAGVLAARPATSADPTVTLRYE